MTLILTCKPTIAHDAAADRAITLIRKRLGITERKVNAQLADLCKEILGESIETKSTGDLAVKAAFKTAYICRAPMEIRVEKTGATYVVSRA